MRDPDDDPRIEATEFERENPHWRLSRAEFDIADDRDMSRRVNADEDDQNRMERGWGW